MIYTGIGSRGIPDDKFNECVEYGKKLAAMGYTLRSGGANGCDSAFEQGCDLAKGEKQIFLPWKGFNGNNSDLFNVTNDMLALAQRFHPNWKVLGEPARKLMARNGCQVLGETLNSPTDFIICWTENGEMKGGTAQALRIAKSLDIPIFNIAVPLQQNLLDNYIERIRLWDEIGF